MALLVAAGLVGFVFTKVLVPRLPLFPLGALGVILGGVLRFTLDPLPERIDGLVLWRECEDV